MHPISELMIRAGIADEHVKDSNFPINPIEVHCVRLGLQVHNGIGEMACFGKWLVMQDTDIGEDECEIYFNSLVKKRLLVKIDTDAYRITNKGILCARKIEEIFNNVEKKVISYPDEKSLFIRFKLFFREILQSLELIDDESECISDDEYVLQINGKENIQMVITDAGDGQSYAQYLIGSWYCHGLCGFRKNQKKAYSWYKKAALGGNPTAQCVIGKILIEGKHVKRDVDLGISMFRKSAEQGNAEAQRTLGYYYLVGENVPKDLGQAFIWMQRAAEQEDATAMANLGFMYMEGRGIPLDQKRGLYFLRRASAAGNEHASDALKSISSK